MIPEADERSEAAPQKGPRMPHNPTKAQRAEYRALLRELMEQGRRMLAKAPRMPQDRITYPFETDIERADRIAQAALWDPQSIIDGKGPPRCHKLVPGSESVAYCGLTFGPGPRSLLNTPPGAYLCRTCLRLHGGPF